MFLSRSFRRAFLDVRRNYWKKTIPLFLILSTSIKKAEKLHTVRYDLKAQMLISGEQRGTAVDKEAPENCRLISSESTAKTVTEWFLIT